MGSITNTITAEQAKRELRKRGARRELARRHLLKLSPSGMVGFLALFPPPTDDPARGFIYGPHIGLLCDEVQRAVDRVSEGQSSFLMVTMPPRHSKSSIISKRLPAWYLGKHPEHESIMSSHDDSLVHAHSRDAKMCVMTPEYERTFGVRLSADSRAKRTWGFHRHQGKVNASGVGASVTGKGAHLLIGDDLHSGWVEAQSEVNRNRVWNTLTNDLFTRLAPVHCVVITMTRWHVDDVWGRVVKAMEDDPDFPQFRQLIMPWRGEATLIDEHGDETTIDYEEEWGRRYLFEERYKPDWYRRMKASLRNPAAGPALFDCKPIVSGGNRFAVDKITYHDTAPPGLKWCRYWDLASSNKERSGNNPSRTAGTLLAVDQAPEGHPVLWVKDCVYGLWEAPQRNRMIESTARRDGMGTKVVLETVGGYVDAAQLVEEKLRGFATVSRDCKQVDKDIRAQNLEPVMDAGHVCVVRGEWNGEMVNELSAYPSGKNDDIVDTVTGGFEEMWNPGDWLVG